MDSSSEESGSKEEARAAGPVPQQVYALYCLSPHALKWTVKQSEISMASHEPLTSPSVKWKRGESTLPDCSPLLVLPLHGSTVLGEDSRVDQHGSADQEEAACGPG